MLGTHADVSAFCFVEKAKPLPFSAFSAFSAVQSAVYDNGEDFTAEGAEGVGWVLGTHADVSAFCFVEKTKPLPFSAFSAVQSAIAWVLRTHAAFGDSWRPITRACGARTLQLDKAVWDEFHQDWAGLVVRAHDIKTELKPAQRVEQSLVQPQGGTSP